MWVATARGAAMVDPDGAAQLSPAIAAGGDRTGARRRSRLRPQSQARPAAGHAQARIPLRGPEFPHAAPAALPLSARRRGRGLDRARQPARRAVHQPGAGPVPVPGHCRLRRGWGRAGIPRARRWRSRSSRSCGSTPWFLAACIGCCSALLVFALHPLAHAPACGMRASRTGSASSTSARATCANRPTRLLVADEEKTLPAAPVAGQVRSLRAAGPRGCADRAGQSPQPGRTAGAGLRCGRAARSSRSASRCSTSTTSSASTTSTRMPRAMKRCAPSRACCASRTGPDGALSRAGAARNSRCCSRTRRSNRRAQRCEQVRAAIEALNCSAFAPGSP